MDRTVFSQASPNGAALSSLILWQQGTSPDAETLLTLLESCAAESVRIVGLLRAKDVAELERLAQESGDARILLVYQRPAAALCDAMADGTAPEPALHLWCHEVRRLLAFLRRNRRRTVVTDLRQLIGDPRVILGAMGLSAHNLPQLPSLPLNPDPILQLLATDTLRRDTTARALAGELEASALVADASGSSDIVDAQACLARYQQTIREKAEMQALAEERQVEQDTLLEQFLQVQELSEERRQENERLIAQLHQLRQGMESHQAQLNSLKAELDTEQVRTDQLSQELETRLAELAELNSLKPKLEAEQVRTGQLSQELTTQRAEIVAKEEAYQAQLAELKQVLETRETESLRLASELTGSAARITAERDELRVQLENHATELDAVKRSRLVADRHSAIAMKLLRAHLRREADLKRRRWRYAWSPPLKTQIKLLRDSDLFDSAWYLEIYQDLKGMSLTPEEHYIRHGACEGRNPGPRFDSMAYYIANPDVASHGMAALVHYLAFGRKEGRALEPEAL